MAGAGGGGGRGVGVGGAGLSEKAQEARVCCSKARISTQAAWLWSLGYSEKLEPNAPGKGMDICQEM